jgi:WD40 repeat protein/serine/threonine protein kinase
MRRQDSKNREARLAAMLAAYDEALANGTLPSAADTPVELVDRELLDRLEQNKAVLHLLESVWPRCPSNARNRKALSKRAPPAVDILFRPPSRVGRFLIQRELGRGGCGIVYLARDPRLHRDVALKVPRPEVSAIPELRTRFLREAQAAAGLDHPNIVPVYESGEVDGVCYIAAACCEGLTLAAWLRNQPELIPVAVGVTLVAAVADGVQHAHDSGVLHRDIKPSNILLSQKSKIKSPRSRRQGETGRWSSATEAEAVPGDTGLPFVPRLTDFGLARFALDRVGSADGTRIGPPQTLTPSGAILGTPSYMAPEQASACEEKIGPQTDLYSLGVILYEVLTGKPPFSGGSELEILKSIEATVPQPPSKWRPELKGDLDTICSKCLEKEPKKRYASAAALAGDLRRFLSGTPIQARPVGIAERAWRWARGRPALAGLWAVSLIAVLSLLGLEAWHSSQLAKTMQTSAREVANQRALVFAQERLVKQNEYLKDIRQAFRLWKLAQVPQFVDLLSRHVPKSDADEDHRCFAWHYLWQQSHNERMCLQGHLGEVYALAVAPNGQIVASGGQDRTIRLWDLKTGSEIKALRGHSDDVTGLAFSADGKILASASEDWTVRLWDVALGTQIARFQHSASVFCLAMSRDGELLATGGEDKQVRLWRLNGGEEVKFPREHAEEIRGVAFAPDGQAVASADRDGTVKLWDVQTHTLRASLPTVGRAVHAVSFSHDGKILVAGGDDKVIRLWDANSWKPLGVWQGHTDSVHALTFAADDKLLASAGKDHVIRFWNTATGECSKVLQGHTDRVAALAFSPDAAAIFSASWDGSVKLWDLEGPREYRAFYLQPGNIRDSWKDVCLAADATLLAAISNDDGAARLWDVASGQLRAATGFKGDPRKTLLLVLVDSEKTLVRATYDGCVCLVDIATGQERRLSLALPSKARCMSCSPAGNQLAVGHADGTISLWDLVNGRHLSTLRGNDAAQRLRFSPDGKLLVACWCGLGQVWDIASQQPLSEWRQKGWISSTALSDDGRTMAMGYYSGTIEIRNAFTGQVQHTLLGQTGLIGSLAFCPGGKVLAAGNENGAVKLWDLATGQEIITLDLPRPSTPIPALAFSADGKTLAAYAPWPGRPGCCVWSGAHQLE